MIILVKNTKVYSLSFLIGSNDYVNNYLQPFLQDAQTYSHDAFVDLLMTTLNGQLRVNIQHQSLRSAHSSYQTCSH